MFFLIFNNIISTEITVVRCDTITTTSNSFRVTSVELREESLAVFAVDAPLRLPNGNVPLDEVGTTQLLQGRGTHLILDACDGSNNS